MPAARGGEGGRSPGRLPPRGLSPLGLAAAGDGIRRVPEPDERLDRQGAVAARAAPAAQQILGAGGHGRDIGCVRRVGVPGAGPVIGIRGRAASQGQEHRQATGQVAE